MADIDLCRCIGLADAVLASLEKNAKLAAKVVEVIKASGLKGCDATTGNLLYHVASKLKDSLGKHRPFLAREIAAGHLKLNVQVRPQIAPRDCVQGEPCCWWCVGVSCGDVCPTLPCTARRGVRVPGGAARRRSRGRQGVRQRVWCRR